MASLSAHFAYLEAEFSAALAAPLSRRKAMLVAMLVDAYADRAFVEAGADDILDYRTGLAAGAPALRLVFELCTQSPAAPHLVNEAVAVPIAGYKTLGVADFMVSLYNDHTVQRVLIALPDGSRQQVHAVLGEAIAALRRIG